MGCMLKKMINELFIKAENFVRSVFDFFKFLQFFYTKYDKNKKNIFSI